MPHAERGPGRAVGWAMPFAAGAVAVPTVHQAVLWLLHTRGWAPWPAYALTPTRPFGVPALVSAAFWGGVWGVPLALVVRRAGSTTAWHLRGALFGAVAPNVVGAGLVALGHGAAPARAPGLSATASAVVVNACWGLAVAALLRVGAPARRPSRPSRGTSHGR